jgi:hypothetical protein
MLKKEYTLSDVVAYFKNNHIDSFEEDIDNFGGYFITAARIAAVIVAPNAITALSNFCGGIDAASLKVSKLFSWLPDKFKYSDKGREDFAIKRHELSSIIYIKLLDLAIANAINEIFIPLVKNNILKDIQLNENDIEEITKEAKESEELQYKISIDTYSQIDEVKITDIVDKIMDSLVHCLIRIKYNSQQRNDKDTDNHEKLKIKIKNSKEEVIKKSYLYFNVFLLNLATEFPEFNLWFDIHTKQNITNEFAKFKKNQKKKNEKFLSSFQKLEELTKEAINHIDDLNKNTFIRKEGFPSFESTFEQLFKIHTENIISKLDESKRECIKVHHNSIKEEVEKRLSNDNTIEGIVYPKNKEIYIAQGYNTIVYKRKEHKKSFLTVKGFDEKSEKGEDVGMFLLKKLIDPNTTLNPIIMLGNPGAGKSIFSKHFAEKLCNTNDFVPFLIRLRDVASSSTDVTEHINKGIAQSIGSSQDINWLELAKLFKERIPVVILDGFDELMQFSKSDINNYVQKIKELQEKALNHEICLKVILTSRIAVMQDVSIPEGTTILKLNPFDEPRKSLWIERWNSFQTKDKYSFKLPATNKKVQELSQEPLLLFMLAVYDFPDNKLLSIANDISFNQSHLYDSLLTDFGKRQLQKEDSYLALGDNEEEKEKEEEKFRLRLGMIALLMFLNDSTNKDIERLNDELKACNLSGNIDARDVLTGFFFVHQNKSTEETGRENFNYEFLHKSFGEFLAADFMLRIAKKMKDRKTKDEELFKFCFGYNWLNKHPEIQKFLFEHAYYMFNFEHNEQERVIEEIQDSLSKLFDGTLNNFPVTRFSIIGHDKTKIEHISIYSQNLIFLWLALSKQNDKISFDVFPPNRNNDCSITNKEKEFAYLAQDREVLNRDKLFWKRICSLWQLIGNYQSVAKLYEWIEVKEDTDKIILTKRKAKYELTNNLFQASLVACNDFNFILSLFDAENKIENKKIILKLKKIYEEKPELSSLGNDALLFRIELNSEKILFDYLLRQENLNKRQLDILCERFIAFSNDFSPEDLFDIGKELLEKSRENRISDKQIKLINYIYSKKPFVLDRRRHFLNEYSERILHKFEFDEPNDTSVFIDYIALIDNFCEMNPNIWNNRGFYKMTFHNIDRASRYNPLLGIRFLKIANKSISFQSIHRFFPSDYFEELLHRLFSEKYIFDNKYYFLEFLILISELNGDFTLKSNKMLKEYFGKSLSLQHIENSFCENPLFALKYIKAIKKISQNTNLVNIAFLRNISINFFDQIVSCKSTSNKYDNNFDKCEFCDKRFDCDMRKDRHRIYDDFGEVPNYIDSISIINEIAEFLPKEQHFRSEIEKRFLIYDRHKDFDRIFHENSLFAIEYFKLLINFDIETEHQLRYLERELSEYLHRGRRDSKVILEILKALNRMNRVLRYNNLETLFDEIVQYMRENKEYIRENPEIALESINFLSNCGQPKIIFDIFPEFGQISKRGEELSHLQTFYNIFKK